MKSSRRMGEEEKRVLLELKKILKTLSPEEVKAFAFIWDNISVGELLYEKEMSQRYGISRPHIVARSLREKGLVERGEGCYNLARRYRTLRKLFQSYAELLRVLDSLFV